MVVRWRRSFKALRLPPGADLLLRALQLSSHSAEDPFLIAFATSLVIGDRFAESWAGQAGLSPASGDFTLTGLLPELERKVDDMRGAACRARPVREARRYRRRLIPVTAPRHEPYTVFASLNLISGYHGSGSALLCLSTSARTRLRCRSSSPARHTSADRSSADILSAASSSPIVASI